MGRRHRGPYEVVVTTPRESPTALLPEVVAVLEDAVDGFTSLVEGEARSLSSSALMCVFNHLYLQDASFNLSSFIAPVNADSREAAAATMKSYMDAMLNKYKVVGPPSDVGGTSDAPGDEVLLASGGGAQV